MRYSSCLQVKEFVRKAAAELGSSEMEMKQELEEILNKRILDAKLHIQEINEQYEKTRAKLKLEHEKQKQILLNFQADIVKETKSRLDAQAKTVRDELVSSGAELEDKRLDLERESADIQIVIISQESKLSSIRQNINDLIVECERLQRCLVEQSIAEQKNKSELVRKRTEIEAKLARAKIDAAQLRKDQLVHKEMAVMLEKEEKEMQEQVEENFQILDQELFLRDSSHTDRQRLIDRAKSVLGRLFEILTVLVKLKETVHT